jgi:hypothetical protein
LVQKLPKNIPGEDFMKTRFFFHLQGLLSFSTFLVAVSASATLHLQQLTGDKLIELPIANGRSEICVLPHHLLSQNYSPKDLKTEATLCGLQRLANTGVCPKVNSTNPGLNFFSLPHGVSAPQLEAADCNIKGADKVAKYKLSTSCSYAPSLLGYYHVSRLLGGIGNVPPAVLRTFDLNTHLQMARRALSQTPRGDLIHQTWASLYSQLQSGEHASRKDLLLTENFDQSYGALQINPSKESFYKEFFNGGRDNLARAQNFRDQNFIMRLLASPRDANELVGQDFNTENIQKLVQMKDASEMILLDTLLNQQDRFGNIHFQNISYFITQDSDGSRHIHADKHPPENALAVVTVKRMLLKDNDCGVSKANIARQAHLSERLAHLDPETYRRLLWLQKAVQRDDVKAFFAHELLFTNSDFHRFTDNLDALTSELRQACEQGRLKLDLDLDSHFSLSPVKAQNCAPLSKF